METPTRGARSGLIFFACYGLLYTGFVFVAAFAPGFLERQIAGVNLAVLSGIALIVGAIALSILYCWLRRDDQ